MPDETFTIRALCNEFGVSARTLRFYEAKGLLDPARDGQHRLFTARDRARLRLILRGKRFGFSLAEIGALLDLYDLGDGGVTQLTATLAAARRQHADLVSRREDLDLAIGDLEEQIGLVERTLDGLDPTLIDPAPPAASAPAARTQDDRHPAKAPAPRPAAATR